MAITYNADKDLNGIYQDDGGVFSSNNATLTAFDYFPDNAEVNDAVYFGSTKMFRNITLYVGTPFSADSQTFAWEYWNGSSWVSLPDISNGDAMTFSNQQIVTFTSPTDWSAKQIGNNYIAFWVRCRLVSVVNPTEGGAQSTQKVKAGDHTIVVTGTANMNDVYNADISGGWGVVSKLAGMVFSVYQVNCYLSIGDEVTTTTFTTNYTALVSLCCYPIIKAKATWNASHSIIEFVLSQQSFTTNPYGSNSIDLGTGNTVWDWVIVSLKKGRTVSRAEPNMRFLVSTWTNMRMYLDYIFEFNLPGWSNLNLNDFSINYNCYITSPVNPLIDFKGTNIAMINGGTLENASLSDAVSFVAYSGGVVFYLRNGSYRTYSFGGTKTATAYIQYSLNLTIQDKEGNTISGAAVTIKDYSGVEVFNGSTDDNGQISKQWLTKIKSYRQEGASPIETILTPHTITISKSGYQTKTMKLTMDRKREEVVVLEPAVNLLMPMGERIYKNLKPADGQNKVLWQEV